MSDRNDHYVPEKRIYGDKDSKTAPLTSDDAKNKVLVREGLAGIGPVYVERYIALGMADEYNRDLPSWWWADYSDTTEDSGAHWSKFDGHHVCVSVELNTWNERVVNEWKGRDEVRKAGHALVHFDEKPVWEVGHRDVLPMLLKLHHDIQELLQLQPLVHYIKGETEWLIGRKVYYREQPGTITSFIGDQGCVIIEPESGIWNPVAYRDGMMDDEYERREPVKDLILSPHIWWWRD
jgi:hypothetical protein